MELPMMGKLGFPQDRVVPAAVASGGMVLPDKVAVAVLVQPLLP